MGTDPLYELRAVVSYLDVLERHPVDMPYPAIPLDQELALVPLPAPEPAPDTPPADRPGFRWLTPGLTAAVRALSAFGPAAYLEIDCRVGHTHQAVAVWAEGALAYGPAHTSPATLQPLTDPSPVQVALRRLGVLVDDDGPDEFAAVGLDRFRATEDWLTRNPAG